MATTITRAIGIALICIATLSCEKEDLTSDAPTSSSKNTEMESKYLEQFSIILSKAVANDKDLRDFIKNESIKQFDKDYDIFYPFVKDEILASGLSFRDAILKFTTPKELGRIEAHCPLLNIFVPDWSWINGYSAETWDTSDNFVTVSKKSNEKRHTIYYNGSIYDTLDVSGFPSYPVLIVKNNERLRISNARTKSSGTTYEFTHKEFDNTNNIQTRANRNWHYDPVIMPVEGCSDFVPESDIDPLLKNAYIEFANNAPDDACQRDYIYYGMSKNNPDHGRLRSYIRERLYRFKITKGAYGKICDQDEDPRLHETIDVIGRKNSYDSTELYDIIWTQGSFTFQFDIFIGIRGHKDEYLSEKLVFPELARDVFDLSKVRRKYKHQTALERGHYIYYFNSEDLVPKWIYPDSPVYLPSWDISNESTAISIQISEIDASETKEHTIEQTYKYTTNFNTDGTISKDKDIKSSFGLKYGETEDNTIKTTLKYTTTLTSDDLGMINLEYNGNILTSPSTQIINNNSISGFIVSSPSVGDVTITLLPTDIR